MCNCREEINKELEPLNARISVALKISNDLSTMSAIMLVAIEKIEKNRKPLPKIFMSYCPFCGEKIGN